MTPLQMEARRAIELKALNDFIAAGKMRIIAPRWDTEGEANVSSIYGTPEGITIGSGDSLKITAPGDQDVPQGREAEVLDAVWTEG